MSESLLELDSVHIRYPGRREPALDGLSLLLEAGQRLGIAGRTGAGKSTTALFAAGFVPRVVRARVEGRLIVGGRPVEPDRSLAGEVGIVFSTPSNQLSASKLTVREEIAFGLENIGLDRAAMDGRIDQAMFALGIDRLAQREPYSLSGGEQQRVAIASMIAMGSRVLVLDEPTGQLDPAGTVSVARLLAQLAAEGSGVLSASHDPDLLGGMDRCLLLADGRRSAEGVPGAALSSERLEPLGMRPPTAIALAEALGLEPGLAFDEDALASALDGAHPARTRGTGDSDAHGDRPQLGARSARSERGTPTIEVERLTFRYDVLEALRDVSLSIAAGERVAIVGENGAGKTTLVKHLIGLLRPAAGAIRLDGHDIAEMPTHRLAATVGFAFQDPDDQLFSRSVEREVAFGPRNLRLPPERSEELVRQAVLAVGLDGELATNPYDLDVSGRKLVALASILAMDPAVLVLDEPTTGQDWPGVARVGAIVDDMHAAGRTVIAITHDMEFAAAHFERVVVMRSGMVVADGPPETVFAPINHDLLASTGLLPPVTARLAARLGWATAPLSVEALLARA